jgi:hypothetical protein
MEIGVKDVLPTQMSGAYATDGIGNIAVKAFTPPYKVAYQYDAVATSSNGQTPAAWDTVNKSLDISASILGINTTDYLTHLIMTVFMENPNVGMWLAFTTDNSVYYKVEANVSNTQSNKRLEGQTMVIPVQHQSDLSWIPMLWIKHRNMGKFVVQLRGIIYRRGA